MENYTPPLILFGCSLAIFGLTAFALWWRWRGPRRIRNEIAKRSSPRTLRSALKTSFWSLLFYMLLGAVISVCLVLYAQDNFGPWQHDEEYRGTRQQDVAVWLYDSALTYGEADRPLPLGAGLAVFLGVTIGGWLGMRQGMKVACGRYFITKGMIKSVI